MQIYKLRHMENRQDRFSRLIRYLMREDTDPLIEEFGLQEILNALADYCARQVDCSNFSKESERIRWTNTEGLLRKAGEAWAPEPTQEAIPEIHAEAIKRFLSRLLENALSALGSPPRVSIEIYECEITPLGAEMSQGLYEPWGIYQCESLVLFAPTYEHYCALVAAYPVYCKAARGLFRTISFKYPGCTDGFMCGVK